MNTEVADFILSDEDRVVFIHVKGVGDKEISKCSASKLHEICGQATKNIQFLSMFNELPPKHLKRWSSKWESNKVNGHVDKRIIRGDGTPTALWRKIQKRINNPLSVKEVWLVLGGLLSKKELISQLQKDSPSHEAVQAAILLHGTMTNVSSIGAKLRIFCYP